MFVDHGASGSLRMLDKRTILQARAATKRASAIACAVST